MNMHALTNSDGVPGISVVADKHPCVRLRTIQCRDQNNLLRWRNANREWFFCSQLITLAEQLAWFGAYRQRRDDYLFIVEVGGVGIGCMGIRLRETWDIYNIIRSDNIYSGGGYMGAGLEMMREFARWLRPLPVVALVFKANPAMGWYYHNGFKCTEDGNKGDTWARLTYS